MAKASLLILKVLLTILFSVWVSLWLLQPTRTWEKKWREAEEKAMKTVFNYNGLSFAVYTFPFLALAMVGFIYLELKLRTNRMRPESKLISALSNPIVVNRYLGILTGTEILLVFLFVTFLFWTFYAHISNDFKKMMPTKSLKLSMWQYKVLKVATRCGLLAEACLALLLLPILRGMAIFRILGVQFEVSVRYHIWLGTTMITFATLHGAGTFFTWGIKHHIQDEMWNWQPTGRIYLAGEIALAAGLAIWITSLPHIRRKHFEIFYYTHHLYVIFFTFFLFHAGDRHFYMVFPGIFLFVLDKFLRVIQSRPKTCILSARVFPCRAIELTLPKDPKLTYTPASIIFVKIPRISELQWHSFSITSSSSVDHHTMSVIIKSEGWWTNALYNLVSAKPDREADQRKCLPIAVEGPYGSASADFLSYDSLLLVAGGIGITPFLSILQEIASARSNGRRIHPKRVLLIYAVKKTQDVSLLNPVLAQLLNVEQNYLKLKVFVTREFGNQTVGEVLNEVSQIKTIDFDTSTSKYAAYGAENLLWMAAIVGLCSIIFLVLLICFNWSTHFYGEMPSGRVMKVPSSATDLFLSCSFVIAIICSSLLAIVLRRKRVGKELLSFSGIPIETTKPTGIGIDNTLVEHEIHFGGRPDFREVFCKFSNETEGSSVGVFVCGPESMKESVALTCKLSSRAFRVDSQKRKLSVSFHSLNFTL
ncbi:ferric reduction oxidase 8, mitochondrial-like isoform X2 [Coffea arabica]|uniref:Ferric reduction oxidase 8, mitochondrial-like isoform X2 n=1 Tax=Coffea arabica TaxID=13443 RepID=A0A6P6XCB3_COFAR|nr:ferric reduction oxidase 8, mitochondrial-like isoform X1 [Coffea arabica]